jgi:acyl dehydratase
MATQIRYEDVEVGTALPAQSFPVRRLDLVKYAGASGDFNYIHWNQRVAQQVGLPDVVAHGMFTMAEAGRVVTDWVGDPGAVLEYGVRFTKPVVVPDTEDGATVEVAATVKKKLENRQVQVELLATCAGEKVLGQARALVQLG